MSVIPDNRDSIDQIKERLDIVTLIEKSVRLKKAGKNYLGLCPFHGEKTPSFIVSPDIQRYKCFGCGKSGDIFNFTQELENLEFGEVLEKLANEAGVELVKRKENKSISDAIDINEEGMKFFMQQLDLPNNRKAKEYLTNRGLKEDAIKRFSIGYSGSYNSLLKHFRTKKGVTRKALLDSGLFTEKNGEVKDRFINRIMFPIRSVSGKVIAFTARQMPGDDFGPKYLNTPETTLFHKRDTLFGIYEAKNEIRKNRYAILCEGSTDVIAAHMSGFANCVAPLGTGLTQQQIQLLKRYCDTLLFLFDSDSAGQKAIERGFKLASQEGMNTYSSSTAPYKDIDEMLKASPTEAAKVCRPKVDTFTYLIESKLKDLDITEKSEYDMIINYALDLLTDVKVQTNLIYYQKKFYSLTNIKLNLSQLHSKDRENKGDLQNTPRGSENRNVNWYNNADRNSSPQQKKKYLWSDREIYYIALILRENHFLSLLDIEKEIFQNVEIKEFITQVQSRPKEDISHVQTKDLLLWSDLSENVKKMLEELHFKLDTMPLTTSEPHKEIKNVYSRIKSDSITRQMQNLRVKIASAEAVGNDDLVNQLTDQILLLSKELNK